MTVTRGHQIDALLNAARACHTQAGLIDEVTVGKPFELVFGSTNEFVQWSDRLHHLGDDLGRAAVTLAGIGDPEDVVSA